MPWMLCKSHSQSFSAQHRWRLWCKWKYAAILHHPPISMAPPSWDSAVRFRFQRTKLVAKRFRNSTPRIRFCTGRLFSVKTMLVALRCWSKPRRAERSLVVHLHQGWSPCGAQSSWMVSQLWTPAHSQLPLLQRKHPTLSRLKSQT